MISFAQMCAPSLLSLVDDKRAWHTANLMDMLSFSAYEWSW